MYPQGITNVRDTLLEEIKVGCQQSSGFLLARVIINYLGWRPAMKGIYLTEADQSTIQSQSY